MVEKPHKIHRKKPVLESVSKNVAGLSIATLLENPSGAGVFW